MTDYTGTDNLEIMAEAVNYNQFLTELILEHAQDDDLILDFGAGIGTFAERVKQHNLTVHAVETDASQAEIIQQKKIRAYRDIDEVADETIDYIYSLNVLEHIEDDQAICQQLFNKLKPGGRILIYVPAMQVLFSSMDKKVCHYRRYSRQRLGEIAENAGFTIECINYADSAGFFATLAYKWFGNDQGDINLKALVTYDRLVFPISQLLDKFTSKLFGKNVYLLATRPENDES